MISSVDIPKGIYIDHEGNVWLCEGLTSPSDLGRPSLVGKVPLDENGSLVSDDCLWQFGVTPTSIEASFSADYQNIASISHFCRYTNTTNALATDYVLRDLGSTGGEAVQFLALHQEGSRLALSHYEWSDGVLIAFGTYVTTKEPFEDSTSCLYRILRHLNKADLFGSETLAMLYLSDEEDILQHFFDAWRERAEDWRFHATILPRRCEKDAIARGAACISMMLNGLMSGFLLLDVIPFDIGLAYGDCQLDAISSGATIPTAYTESITLRAGEKPCVVIGSGVRRGLRRHYPLPVEEDRLEALVANGAELVLTIDINACGQICVSLRSGEWERQYLLGGPSGLSPLPVSAMLEPVAKPTTTPCSPESLLELIAVLDDVDSGVRSLTARDIQTPAGSGILALRSRLLKAITSLGAEYRPALGACFDPYQHEAVSTVEDPTLPKNYIVDEFRRGFVYQNRILRYSQVRVANPE